MEKFDASNPIYLQVAEKIKRKIVRGELKPGHRLPAIREVAIEVGVNPNTIQRTFGFLEQTGTIEIKRGLGAFVVEDPKIVDKLRRQMLDNILTKFITNVMELTDDWNEVTSELQTRWLKVTKRGKNSND